MQDRLNSEIFITGKVGYHRAKPGCQIPGFRFPPYLSNAWSRCYQVGLGTPLTLNVQYQTFSCPKYQIQRLCIIKVLRSLIMNNL